MKIALQLWSLNEECRENFIGTLKRVSDMGYDGVEFAGYGGLKSSELKSLLEKLNLKVCGSHVPLEEIKNNIDQVIKYNLEIGNKCIICPYAKFENYEDIDEIANILNSASIKCKKYGLVIGYHNHNHEFEKFNNNFVLNELFNRFSDEIISELDTYWVEYSGVNAVSYIKDNIEKTKLLHIKDMKLKDGEKVSTEVGNGILDIESFMDIAKENNIEWVVVEQESFDKPKMDSVKESLDYLKGLIK